MMVMRSTAYERLRQTRPTGPVRVVLQGPEWRVVATDLPDENGVLQTQYLIEVTELSDKDLLGQQRWHELTGQSAQVEWVIVARRFLDELLKQAGEIPGGEIQSSEEEDA
jgi:hypothetical protein